MKQVLLTALLIIVIIATTAFAGDKYTLSLSGGYTDFRMTGFNNDGGNISIYNEMPPDPSISSVASRWAVEHGFSFSAELLYAETEKYDIGFGLEFLYGSGSNDDNSSVFDAERYSLTGDPRGSASGIFNSKAFFVNPYIILKNHFTFLSLSPYFKATMGIGLCRFNASIYDEDKSFSLTGASFTLALGGTVINLKDRPIGGEIGYRYLKTESISINYHDGSAYWQYLNGLTVDLSGIYARTSISFSL